MSRATPLVRGAAVCLGGIAILTAAADGPGAGVVDRETAASQWTQYQADVPKTIVELQPFRSTASAEFQMTSGRGLATLINLNPRVNAWFLLTLRFGVGGRSLSYHVENPRPDTQMLALSAHGDGVRIAVDGRDIECPLWPEGQASTLQQAQHSELPYAPLCGDRLYLRNAVSGTFTHLERVTTFLRDHVWGGEKIVGFVKQEFFADAFLEKGGAQGVTMPKARTASAGAPLPPQIDATFAQRGAVPEHLGIDVGQGPSGLLLGQWYAIRDSAGMFISVIQPEALAAPVARQQSRTVNELDKVEAAALDYIVAIDLSQFDLGFALGTDHPRVEWSDRVLESARKPKLLGPDGIGSVAPLVVNGMINPPTVERAAAAFAGGFKREHGAFRYGALALENHGSHYGFIEQGVIFSKLQPGLATLFVDDTGAVHMKTWAPADDAELPHIKDARQNGVPLIEYDEKTATSLPGALVNSWGAGNWSGSSEEHLRTLRAGTCLLTSGARQFLVYGYFSTATPSAMARVFQAYGCRYAMHLDMNALEHTYFAVYSHKNGRIAVQHLIEGMAEVDRKGGDELAPRFLSFPDDRDFFYLTRKRTAP
jgi:hypothetical protein